MLAHGPFNIVGIMVPKDRVIAVVVAVVLSLFLYLFLKTTKFGQAMVASAQNPEGAVLQGISPNKMAAMAMAAMGPLLLVIIILVIKPQGFFGHAE